MDSYNSFVSVVQFIKTYGRVLLFVLIGLALSTMYIYTVIRDKISSCQTAQMLQPFTNESPTSTSVFVYVSGAVTTPGVFELPQGSRVVDALSKAGPITNNASILWVSQIINLAQFVTDGQKIYVPFESDLSNENLHEILLSVSESYQTTPSTSVLPDPQDVVANNDSQILNVNTASQSDLTDLPGVGEVYAEKIIANRPYTDLKDFISKTKISAKTVGKFQELITF